MPTPILMPALSPTMEEGTLAKWHVKEGDVVKSGQVIAEIETDKATMEVEAVDEGRVGRILVAEGTEGVKVNAEIAVLIAEGEEAPAAAAPARAPAKAAAPSRGNGGGMSSSPAAPAKPAPVTPAAPAAPAAPASETSAGGRIFASPLAKRLAGEAGLDLAALEGTGPGGRIVKRDIEAAARAPQPTAPRPAEAKAEPARPQPLEIGIFPFAEGAEIVPLDGMRKTVAKRMTASFRDVPHFPLTIDLELDRLLALRKELNGKIEDEAAKVSVNDFVLRASALALKKVPEANASYTEKALVKHPHADIAVAVAIPGGLITPIIFKAETKGLSAIAAEMKDKAARARVRKLKPEEYQGGTFSVSNLGMMGIKSFASIINEPHGAILSVGAGEQRAVVKAGALAIATVMSVTLTCDHRVVDGAIGAAFLAAFKKFIEDPVLMLL